MDYAKLTAKPLEFSPTDPALELNIKRGHYQVMMWYNCVDGNLPRKGPSEVLNDSYLYNVVVYKKSIYGQNGRCK